MRADTIVVAVIVGAAALAVLRRVWRTVRQARAGGGGTRVAGRGGAGCPGCELVADGEKPAEWDRVGG